MKLLSLENERELSFPSKVEGLNGYSKFLAHDIGLKAVELGNLINVSVKKEDSKSHITSIGGDVWEIKLKIACSYTNSWYNVYPSRSGDYICVYPYFPARINTPFDEEDFYEEDESYDKFEPWIANLKKVNTNLRDYLGSISSGVETGIFYTRCAGKNMDTLKKIHFAWMVKTV